MNKAIPVAIFLGACSFMHVKSEKSPLIAPGPIYTFGQNILKKGKSVMSTRIDHIDEDNSAFSHSNITYLHGVTDRFSIRTDLFLIWKDKRPDSTRTRGIGSLVLQGEYSIYEKNDTNFRHQATVVTAVFLPCATTAFQSIPANKSSAFFLGATNSILANNWYCYYALGGLITTRRDNQKLPNRFFYDIGLGNKFGETDNYYIAWILEFSGLYSGSAENPDIFSPDSNVILLGPSLRWATEDMIFQVAFQYPITQRNIPKRSYLNYRGALSFAWRFGR